jgi:hypothetical protein
MSTITNGYTTLMNGLQQSWLSGSHASVPLLFRNEQAKPPVNSAWVEADVVWGPGSWTALDASVIEGSLVVQVYTPKGEGTYSSSLLSDGVRDLITSMSYDAFRFDAAGGPVGVPNDGPWFQRVITTQFQMEADRL